MTKQKVRLLRCSIILLRKTGSLYDTAARPVGSFICYLKTVVTILLMEQNNVYVIRMDSFEDSIFFWLKASVCTLAGISVRTNWKTWRALGSVVLPSLPLLKSVERWERTGIPQCAATVDIIPQSPEPTRSGRQLPCLSQRARHFTAVLHVFLASQTSITGNCYSPLNLHAVLKKQVQNPPCYRLWKTSRQSNNLHSTTMELSLS